MNGLLESRGDQEIVYFTEGPGQFEASLGAMVRLDFGSERHRLCDYPEDLLDLVEADAHACVFRAVGPGRGEVRVECAEAGAWASGRGSRVLEFVVQAGFAERPEPLRAPDICL